MCRALTTRVIGMIAASLFVVVSTAAANEPSQSIQEGLIRANAEGMKAQASVVQAQAGMVSAIAQARKSAAESRKTLEECRGLAIDNDVKAAKAFFEKRTEREQYMAKHVRRRPTAEDLMRYSQARRPKRLSQGGLLPVSLSPTTTIPWPATLRAPEFDSYRVQVEAAFEQRSPANSGVGSGLYREVHQLTTRMRDELKARIGEMSAMEYISAKRFLESVAYEARFSPNAANSPNLLALASLLPAN